MGDPTAELFRGGMARAGAVDGVVFQFIHADQHHCQPAGDPLLGCIIALGLLAALAHAAERVAGDDAEQRQQPANRHDGRGVWNGSEAVPFGHRFIQAPPVWVVWLYYAIGVLTLSNRIPVQRRRVVAVSRCWR
jgi:hypothetical protein